MWFSKEKSPNLVLLVVSSALAASGIWHFWTVICREVGWNPAGAQELFCAGIALTFVGLILWEIKRRHRRAMDHRFTAEEQERVMALIEAQLSEAVERGRMSGVYVGFVGVSVGSMYMLWNGFVAPALAMMLVGILVLLFGHQTR
jgi:hypothetical protein